MLKLNLMSRDSPHTLASKIENSVRIEKWKSGDVTGKNKMAITHEIQVSNHGPFYKSDR